MDLDALVEESYSEFGTNATDADIRELAHLTRMIRAAKDDAVEESARGKESLRGDIRHLYGASVCAAIMRAFLHIADERG